MIRSIFIILLLVNLYSLSDAAAIKPIEMAEALYKADSYNAAMTEYKRHIFFFQDDENTPDIYRQIGLCYRNLGDWVNSRIILHKAIDLQENDSLRLTYRIDLAVTDIASGNYSTAELNLLKLTNFAKQPEIVYQASFFLMVAYLYQGKWEECRSLLTNEKFALSNTPIAMEIQAILEDIPDKDRLSFCAKWLSVFIPGLGQFCTGHNLEALNAITINGFIVYNTYDLLKSNSNWLDLTFWLFLSYRFWWGNSKQAADLVRQDKIEEEARLNQEILHLLRFRLSNVNGG